MKNPNIEEKLIVLAHENEVPLNVDIELLNKCNMRCRHCYIPDHISEGLSFDTVTNLFTQLKDLGTLNITLTGGEIFLRDDIFKIIQKARSLGFSVTLLTNASLLTENTIKILRDLHLNMIGVSLYSLNEEIYDTITQTHGYLPIVMKNLEFLQQYGIPVRINDPLTIYNKNFEDVESYCTQHGFAFNVSQVILPKTNGDKSNQILRLSNGDFDSANNKIFARERSQMSEKAIDLLNLFPNEPCPMLKITLLIDCQGFVFPCSSMHYRVGNIFKSTLSEIIQSKDLQHIRSITKDELKICSECSLRAFCSRCPGLVYEESNDFYGCSNTVKKIATSYSKFK